MKKSAFHIRPLNSLFFPYFALAVIGLAALFLQEEGWAWCLITGVLFFLHSSSWSVYPDRMVQWIVRIPVRTIPFGEISGMIHRQARVGYRGRRTPPALLLVLAPGTIEEVSNTNALPGFVVQIPLSDSQEESAIEAVTAHYGYVVDGTAVFFHDDPWQ